jgi:hypothetical protein
MDASLISVDDFTGLSIPGLDSNDILALNYRAARGLPGAENSNFGA